MFGEYDSCDQASANIMHAFGDSRKLARHSLNCTCCTIFSGSASSVLLMCLNFDMCGESTEISKHIVVEARRTTAAAISQRHGHTTATLLQLGQVCVCWGDFTSWRWFSSAREPSRTAQAIFHRRHVSLGIVPHKVASVADFQEQPRFSLVARPANNGQEHFSLVLSRDLFGGKTRHAVRRRRQAGKRSLSMFMAPVEQYSNWRTVRKASPVSHSRSSYLFALPKT